MAVGDGELAPILPVPGIRLAAVNAGVRYRNRKDLVLIELAEGSSVAAAFTQNAFCAAPVRVAKRHLQALSSSRYLVINTGNANAGTGQQGLADTNQCVEALAELAHCAAEQVLPFSTGVIGERLPVERIVAALPAALEALAEDCWLDAARGIMTTDTRPKGYSRQLEIGGKVVTFTGIAKGAGMIKPNMATMLAYVATDLGLEMAVQQQLLSAAIDQSFNRITVDGDTSTNDACVFMATGQSGVTLGPEHKAELEQVRETLFSLCRELAHGLVKDAEGASKFISVRVSGGHDEQECLDVAYSVAESPLVKTALFASDPNWGRILAAIGRAGVRNLDVDKVNLSLNGVKIAEHGALAASYTEQAGKAAMADSDIVMDIDLARGNAQTTVWTCDLSHDYVSINADYRS